MWTNDAVDQSDRCLTVPPVIGCVPYIGTGGGGTGRQNDIFLFCRYTEFAWEIPHQSLLQLL